MFVAAITAGATSLGVDVHVAGVVPTPALAFLAGTGDFAAGIMVSASHNPAEDNGLKVLDPAGLKLDDAIEDELEQLIWRTEELGSVPQRRDRAARWSIRRSSIATVAAPARPGPRRSTARGLRIVARLRERLGGLGRARDPGGDRRDASR